MKKIKYPLNKKEKFLIFLSILLPFSLMLLFDLDIEAITRGSFLYNNRNIFYFCFFVLSLVIVFGIDMLFIAKLDKNKIIIKAPLYGVKKEVLLNSIKKVKIDKLGIHILGIESDKEYNILIPFNLKRCMARKDFSYIISIFKNIEIEYDKITYEEVLELLTNKRDKIINLLTIIIIISLICLICYTLFYSFIFFLITLIEK